MLSVRLSTIDTVSSFYLSFLLFFFFISLSVRTLPSLASGGEVQLHPGTLSFHTFHEQLRGVLLLRDMQMKLFLVLTTQREMK